MIGMNGMNRMLNDNERQQLISIAREDRVRVVNLGIALIKLIATLPVATYFLYLFDGNSDFEKRWVSYYITYFIISVLGNTAILVTAKDVISMLYQVVETNLILYYILVFLITPIDKKLISLYVFSIIMSFIFIIGIKIKHNVYEWSRDLSDNQLLNYTEHLTINNDTLLNNMILSLASYTYDANTNVDIESNNEYEIDVVNQTIFFKDNNAICPITLEEYTNGQIITVLPCGHHFSQQYINNWLNVGQNCPLCRLEVF